jgi:endoglucanase
MAGRFSRIVISVVATAASLAVAAVPAFAATGLDGQTGHPSVNSQGLYIKPSAGLNGNSVKGMTFQNIGDKYGPGPGIDGFGAILLTDSSNNIISNNTFDNIENTGSTTGQIHGIYDTHFSSTNAITSNKFENISAEAIKVRDRSNFNVVEHNTFTATGGVSAYRDQFCDQACVNANPGTSRQCASYGNKFYFNTIGTSFTGGQQSAWTLDPPGETYAGNSGCSIPAGEERLHEGSNTLAAAAETRATLTAPDAGISFPLHTSGASIVDASGKPVRLALVNWYGAESPDYVVGGLKYQPVESIINQIVAMGFNGVRLPWSNAMWESNPVVSPSVLSANPQFAGEHARTIFGQVVQDLANAGLMVVLDDHNSTAEWCCSTSDGNSLWYTPKYPQSAWIADWKSVASAFKSVPQVIGADLRNEPRSPATWGGSSSVDWHAAAQLGGDAVQSIDSNLLIFVEGTNYATTLASAGSLPVKLNVGSHLVYSAHNYGFDQTITSYDSWVAKIQSEWGYLVGKVPLWIGEFGTCNTANACVSSTNTANNGNWFGVITRYLRYHNLNWSYWALNGTKSDGAPGQNITYGQTESYGMLNTAWSTPALPLATSTLQGIAHQCPGGQIANGTYYIVNRNSGDVIDIPGSATAQGAVLDQWPLNNGKNQQWKVASLGCGMFSIRSVSDNESLDINGQSTANGGAVDQWDYWGGGNQEFVVVKNSAGYFSIASVNSLDPITVPGSSTTAGTKLQQATPGTGNNQQWSFKAA